MPITLSQLIRLKNTVAVLMPGLIGGWYFWMPTFRIYQILLGLMLVLMGVFVALTHHVAKQLQQCYPGSLVLVPSSALLVCIVGLQAMMQILAPGSHTLESGGSVGPLLTVWFVFVFGYQVNQLLRLDDSGLTVHGAHGEETWFWRDWVDWTRHNNTPENPGYTLSFIQGEFDLGRGKWALNGPAHAKILHMAQRYAPQMQANQQHSGARVEQRLLASNLKRRHHLYAATAVAWIAGCVVLVVWGRSFFGGFLLFIGGVTALAVQHNLLEGQRLRRFFTARSHGAVYSERMSWLHESMTVAVGSFILLAGINLGLGWHAVGYGLAAVLSLMVAFLWVRHFGQQSVVLTDDGIQRHHRGKQREQIPWTQVTEVDASEATRSISLYYRNGTAGVQVWHWRVGDWSQNEAVWSRLRQQGVARSGH